MITLFRQAYLSYKGLFLWLNWPAYISNVFLRPGLIVAMFALTGHFARGRDAAEAYVIGLTAYSIPSIIMGGVLQGFYYERAFGTLSFFFASSGSRLASFFARGALHFPNAVLAVIASIVFSLLVLPTDFARADWASVTACYLTMGVSCTLCALCLGSFCVLFRDWQSFYSLAITLFLVFPGVIIPRSSLPHGALELGALLPTTFGVEALRRAFEGAGLSAVGGKLALEALVGAGYAVAGYGLFCWIEAHARRSGAYEAV